MKYKVIVETEIEVPDQYDDGTDYDYLLSSFCGDLAAFECGQIEFPANYKYTITKIK